MTNILKKSYSKILIKWNRLLVFYTVQIGQFRISMDQSETVLTSLNQPEVVWTGQDKYQQVNLVWTHINRTVWSCIEWSRPVWIIIIQFWPVLTKLDRTEQVWSNLDQFGPDGQFGQVWTSLDEFWALLTNLNQPGPVWTNMEQFGLVWSSLEQSGPV